MRVARPDLTVTIASFNTREVLARCLASLQAHRGTLDLEVIVVDNASTDGSAGMVRDEWPRVTLVVNDRNRYLTGAQNQALAMARGRYVLVLNSDMEVLPGTLPGMVDWMDSHPAAAAASCVEILHGQPKVPLLFQSPREAILRRTFLHRFAGRRPDHFINTAHESGEIQAEVISDAFMVARREALVAIGGFDERLRLYYTEDDICRRLHDAGWEIHFVSKVQVLHIGHGSHSVLRVGRLKILWLNYRDTWRYFSRHHGAMAGLAVWSVFLVQYVMLDSPRWLKSRLVQAVTRRARDPQEA